MGFMGRTHLAAYAAANAGGVANELLAVCDGNEQRRKGEPGAAGNLESAPAGERLFDPTRVVGHGNVDEFLAHPNLDLVSICTPTDSHVDLALRALSAGKHVLVEKPVAREARLIEPLLRAADSSDGLCMPAHCMRFWPGWVWLHDAIESARFGRVLSAVFQRLASVPDWSPDFYGDPERTGGALVDLHIHDADFIQWCFGTPDEVTSAGSPTHLTTIYRYAQGPPHVVAEGGWVRSPGFGIQMRYVVVFEGATAQFDFLGEPQLTLHRDGRTHAVPLPAENGYLGEVLHLLGAIEAGREELRVGVRDALLAARLLERERESLENGARC